MAIKSILISQPKPDTEKSPYFDLEKKYKIKLDFRQFIHLEGVTAREFRKTKINIPDYKAVIFTSRNAIEHFFRVAEDLKVQISPDTKYFCVSEAIALYLQKFILYRKRKVFYGNGDTKSLMDLLTKHKDNLNFLFPCSDVHNDNITEFLEQNNFDFAKAIIYKTVSSDLSDLKKLKYDLIVFFSPAGVKSLFDNFPDFKQNSTKIGAFGPSTSQAVLDAKLKLNVKAPVPGISSMASAIEEVLKKKK